VSLAVGREAGTIEPALPSPQAVLVPPTEVGLVATAARWLAELSARAVVDPRARLSAGAGLADARPEAVHVDNARLWLHTEAPTLVAALVARAVLRQDALVDTTQVDARPTGIAVRRNETHRWLRAVPGVDVAPARPGAVHVLQAGLGARAGDADAAADAVVVGPAVSALLTQASLAAGQCAGARSIGAARITAFAEHTAPSGIAVRRTKAGGRLRAEPVDAGA